jgi:hypothetical protein
VFKELIPNLTQTLRQADWTREMYEELIIGWFRQGMKPEGKLYYDDFIAKIQRGEKISLPDYNNMFLGFDQNSGIKGLENLKGLEDKPILALLNHTNNNGPLGGGWKIVTLSYHVYKTAGNKIRPMHGYDPTACHDLFRERLHKSVNSILIRDPVSSRSGSSSLIQALKNRDSMCLYPEGGFGPRDSNLRKGMSNAGKLIRMCLARDYSLVTVSFRFKNDTFFATFDRIEHEEIPKLERTDKNKIDQDVVDCAMARIARHLPPDHQGYYKHSLTGSCIL